MRRALRSDALVKTALFMPFSGAMQAVEKYAVRTTLKQRKNMILLENDIEHIVTILYHMINLEVGEF